MYVQSRSILFEVYTTKQLSVIFCSRQAVCLPKAKILLEFNRRDGRRGTEHLSAAIVPPTQRACIAACSCQDKVIAFRKTTIVYESYCSIV